MTRAPRGNAVPTLAKVIRPPALSSSCSPSLEKRKEELVVTGALWATTELRESGAESGCGDVGEVAAMSSADL